MELLYVFLAGASVGSFLNVCICRIPRGMGIVLGASRCPGCGKRIRVSDLVPIVSFVMLKGRCRACGGAISMRYPAVELAAGLIFAMIFVRYGASLEFLQYSVLAAFLIVAGMIDLETGDVYTSVVAAGAAAGLAFAFYSPGTLTDSLLGALLGFALTGAAAAAGGMGWGDADLCLLCGLFLGVKMTGIMLFLACLLGAAAGTVLMALSVKSRKDSMPFGPFIAAASVIVILSGDWLLRLYTGMIL